MPRSTGKIRSFEAILLDGGFDSGTHPRFLSKLIDYVNALTEADAAGDVSTEVRSSLRDLAEQNVLDDFDAAALQDLIGLLNTSPVISSNGGAATASVSIVENTTFVANIDATDFENDQITYSISGGADAAFFSIDPVSGELAFHNAPDFETPLDAGGDNSYDVLILAEDAYGASDTQMLDVVVENDASDDGPLPPDGLLALDQSFYLIVEDPEVTRQSAEIAASQASFQLNGTTYQGHLINVTSQAEEDLIENAILGSNGGAYFSSEPAAFWLGGEYIDGQWVWADGPETGDAFTFSDWDTDGGGQEEGQGEAEPYLVLNMFSRPDIDGVWYSYDAGDTDYVRGYVIEFQADFDGLLG